jgi:transglutaminase-like putative cysteine protease
MDPTSCAAAALDPDPAAYVAATRYLDYEHPAVRSFLAGHLDGAAGARERAVRLYYAVRDAIRYDPYRIRLQPETYRASYVIGQGRGYCGQKALVYAAVCRAAGIPARPGYADVQNHLATERLLRLIDTNVFIYHGYVEVHLDGRWVKATPVFNLSLCEKFHVVPLEFDGRTDSLFQPYDAKGRRHMQYLRDRGVRADVPVEEITSAMLAAYPRYFAELGGDGDFEAEAAALGRTAEYAAPQ